MNNKTPTGPPSPPSVVDVNEAPIPPPVPCLDVLERYSGDLVPFDYDATDARGRPVIRQYHLPKIDGRTRLIPESDCRDGARQLEAALVPADFATARALAALIIGRYTEQKFNDAGVFVTEITRLFSENPADLGFKAADLLRSCKFLPNVGDVTAVLKPLVEERCRALHQVRLHSAEHERRAGKGAGPSELPEQIRRFKSLAPAIKAVVGDEAFSVFWPTLWVVRDDGERLVVAQPTRLLRDMTATHIAAISEAAGQTVELVICSKPVAGSRKAAIGPRPIGDVLNEKTDQVRHSGDGGREGEGGS